MSSGQKRTVNVRLLAITLVVVPSVAVGAYFVRESQMPQIARQFLQLADVEEEQAREEPEMSNERASHFKMASNFVFRYVQLAEKSDTAAEIRIADLWDEGADNLAAASRSYFAAKRNSIELYYRAIGAAENDPEFADQIGPMRQKLLAMLQELFRNASLREQAELHLLHDLPRSQKDNDDKVQMLIGALPPEARSAAPGRIDELNTSPRNLAKYQKANPYFNEGLAYLAKAMWRSFVRDSLPTRDEQRMASILRHAVKTNPKDESLTVAYAMLLRDHRNAFDDFLQATYPDPPSQIAAADNVVDELVKSHRVANSLLARAQYRATYGLEGANDDIITALELEPENPKIVRIAGGALFREAIRLPKDDPARDVLLSKAADCFEQLQSLGTFPESYWGAADALMELEENERVTEVLNKGLEEFPNNRELTWRLAKFHVVQGDLDQASKYLAMLDSEKSEKWQSPLDSHEKLDNGVELARAYLTSQKGNPRQAIAYAQRIADGAEATPLRLDARRMVADSYVKLELWDKAATAYEAALSDAPTNTQLQLTAAFCQTKAGHVDPAISHYEAVLADKPNPSLLAPLAELYLRKQALLPERQRDWRKLTNALDQLDKLETDRPWDHQLLRAQMHFIADEPGLSKSILDKMAIEHRGNRECIPKIAQMYLKLEQPQLAQQLIAPSVTVGDNPGSFDETIFQSASLIGEGRHLEAVRVLSAAREQAKGNQKVTLTLAIVSALLQGGNTQEAIRQFQFDELNSANLERITMAVDSFLMGRRFAFVAEWERKIRDAEGGDGTYARFLKCRLLLLSPNLERRREDIEKVREEVKLLEQQRPNWAGLHLVKSGLATLDRQPEKAIEHLQEAFDLGDRRLPIVEQLVVMLYQASRMDDAKDLLNVVKKSLPESGGLSSVGILVNNNDLEAGLQIAQRGVESRPNDPMAHLWLGIVLASLQRDEEALASFEKSRSLGPDDLRTWNGKFSFHVSRKQFDEAEETLKKMAEALSESKAQEYFLLAQGYEQVRPDDAGEMYDKCLAARKEADFKNLPMLAGAGAFFARTGDTTKAIRLFEVAVVLAEESGNEAAAIGAHRTLAALYAHEGAEDWLANFDAHMKKAGVDGENIETNDQLKALILIDRGETENNCEAQTILEDLVFKRRNPDPANQFLLARLYIIQNPQIEDTLEAKEKLESARDLLHELCIGSDNPNYRLRYITLLHQMGDLKAANDQLELLEDSDTHKKDPRVALCRAKWHQLNGDGEELMLEAVNKYVEANKDLKSPKGLRIMHSHAGKILAGFGLHKQATVHFEEAFNLDGDFFLPMVTSLANEGSVDKAIELCREKSETRAHRVVALTAVLASGRLEKEHLQSIGEDVEWALANVGESNRVKLASALFHMVRGNDAEAIRLYKDVLTKAGNNPIALNNLALLLSNDPSQAASAQRYIKKAIDGYGQMPALLDTQAMIFFRNDLVDQAIKKLRLAISLELFPNPTHQFHLAVVLAKKGDLDEAKRNYALAKTQGLDNQLWTNSELALASWLNEQLENK